MSSLTATINRLRHAHRARLVLLLVLIVGVPALLDGPPARARPDVGLDVSQIGAPNGDPASPGAVLRPVVPASVVRAYEHSALRVHSQLLNTAGQPIAGARVDILQRISGSSETQVIGHTVTEGDGTFTALVPAGPSRTIDLAYRAYEGSPLYVAETEIAEAVTAGLRLHITPTHTRPTGTIVLQGRVLGVVPPHGVVVEVLVYYQGAWEPIRTPQTDAAGRFRLTYRFHQAYGRFPFALRMRNGQEGFPYAGAQSRRVDVLTS